MERDSAGGDSERAWGYIMQVLNGNFNAARYRDDVLRHVLVLSRHLTTWITLHDNAQAHKGCWTKIFLHPNYINVIDWPAMADYVSH